MGYRILGFAVWKGAKWYVRRRLGVAASRPALAAGAVAAAIAVAAVAGSRRSGS